MKKDKKTIIIIIAAALAISFFGSYSYTKFKTAEKAKELAKEMPQLEQKILSFELANYAEDGAKKWNLKGDSADILAEVINLENIDMETYDEPRINLTALRGNYDRKNREIRLFDEVEVLTSDGARLITDYLKWDGSTDTITTDKPVRIIRSDVIAEGNGALAMPQMKKIILDKDVRVRLAKSVMKDIDVDTEEGPEGAHEEFAKATITCNGPLEIDYENNIAVFEDNVLVDDRKGRIYSDRMEAFLDPDTKSIVKVIAVGNVKVVRGEDSTFSERAIYTTADQKIILVGSPKIYIHSTEDIEKIEEELEGL